MDDFEPRKKERLPLFFTIVSYILIGIFAVCFMAGHFYFSDFDVDWQLRMAYGQVIGLGGWIVFFIGFLLFNYYRYKYF